VTIANYQPGTNASLITKAEGKHKTFNSAMPAIIKDDTNYCCYRCNC